MSDFLSRRRFFTFDFSDRRTGDRWIHVHRTAMACRFGVRLSSEDARDVPGAGDDPDDHLVALLAQCRDLHASTEGAFDMNVGTVGKGYALDRMAALMRRRGATRALLSAGR